ncbi:MAG: FAD-dependent oxidoreductase [Oscillospiraceae bacterium]|nr:FAD-dependent oxidoreductase [Oscillospiraceae bacterium]
MAPLLSVKNGRRVRMTDVIIIGGGTAGLTAAIYLQRSALQCAVLEAEEFGGRIFPTLAIENYPAMPGASGFEYSENLRAQAETLGAELTAQTARSLVRDGDLWQITTLDDMLFTSRAVIYAAGEKQRMLEVPGEEEFLGRGVATCAACDGALFRDKIVAIIGGGDKALDDALTLSKLCTTVHLIHRREEFRAVGNTVIQVKGTPNITLHLNRIITSINGTSRVENVTLRCMENDEEETLAVSGVFVAIGSIPQTALCAGLVELDKQGYIIAGEDCATSEPGLFVAGDARRKPFRQLVTAAADGATAAKAAADYIMRS